MTDHEQIMICAERYALGRRSYIVGVVVDYILVHIDEMTDHCRHVLIKDIEDPIYGSYGDDCDKEEWSRLLNRLKEKNGGVT